MSITLGSNIFVATTLPLDAKYVAVDNTARDAIVAGVRYLGMQVFVEATGATWQLQAGITNSDWVEFGALGTISTTQSIPPSSTALTTAGSGTYRTKYAFHITSGTPVWEPYLGYSPVTHTNNALTFTVVDYDSDNDIAYCQASTSGAPSASGTLAANHQTRIYVTALPDADYYFVLQDENGSVGVWFNYDSIRTIPAGAAACDRSIEIGTNAGMSDTDLRDAMVTELDADSKFTAISDPSSDTNNRVLYVTMVNSSTVTDTVDGADATGFTFMNIGNLVYDEVSEPTCLQVDLFGGATSSTTLFNDGSGLTAIPGVNSRLTAGVTTANQVSRGVSRKVGDCTYTVGAGGGDAILITEYYGFQGVAGGGGGGGASAAVIYGSAASPRLIIAANGISSADSHMSVSELDQIIFLASNDASAITPVSASPQIDAHTQTGARMRLIGCDDDDVTELVDGNGLDLESSWQSYANNFLDLLWNGSVWIQTGRRG